MSTPLDVRTHLASMLADLGKASKSNEESQHLIERAKASAQVAQAYTGVLKAEIDAVNALSDTGLIPAGLGSVTQYNLGTGKAMRFIGNEEQQ